MYTKTEQKVKNFYCETLALFLFVALIITSFASCSKDIETQKQDNIQSLIQQNLVESMKIDNSVSIRTDSIEGTHYIKPSFSELEEIAVALDQQGNEEGWIDSLIQIYGYPKWNSTLKNKINDSGNIIILPFYRNGIVIAILRSYKTIDGTFFKFYGHSYISNIPNTLHSANTIGESISFVANYLYFQYYLEGQYSPELIDWIEEYDSSGIENNEETNIRSEYVCFTVLEGFISCAGSPSNPTINCTFIVTGSHEDCYLIGGPGLPNFPSWNININDYNPNGNNPNGQGGNGGNNGDDNSNANEGYDDEKEDDEKTEDCLKEIKSFALNNIISQLEAQYGDILCVDDIVNNIIAGLVDEGLECNREAEEIVTNAITNGVVMSNNEFQNTFNDIINSDIIDPCNENLTPVDIANNAVIEMQSMGGCGVQGLISAFIMNEDHIYDYLDDPRLKCIYDNLVLGSDKVFCNTFENFLGDTDIDLTLSNSNQFAANAQTTPYYLTENSVYGNTINISFNPNQLQDFCEVVIVGTFLHEGIHAEMYRLLNDPTLDINDTESIWHGYENSLSQHDNMATAYVKILAEALKERFGDKYTDLQYEAIAWHGLGNVAGENVNTSAWNNLPTDKQNQLISAFEQVNNDCTDDDCK